MSPGNAERRPRQALGNIISQFLSSWFTQGDRDRRTEHLPFTVLRDHLIQGEGCGDRIRGMGMDNGICPGFLID